MPTAKPKSAWTSRDSSSVLSALEGVHNQLVFIPWRQFRAALPPEVSSGLARKAHFVIRVLTDMVVELEKPKPRRLGPIKSLADICRPEPGPPPEIVKTIVRAHAAVVGTNSDLHAARTLVQAIVRNAERKCGKPPRAADYREFEHTWPEYRIHYAACHRAELAWVALWRAQRGDGRVDAWGPTTEALKASGLGHWCRETLKRECRGFLERPDRKRTPARAGRSASPRRAKAA